MAMDLEDPRKLKRKPAEGKGKKQLDCASENQD